MTIMATKMRLLPLPKKLLRSAASSLRHAQLEDTCPIDSESTELDDFYVIEEYDLDGFCGFIELCFEAEVCR